jgi:D-glycero-D-manno-heptose 1,7-bisphosphate phosphatase
MKRFVFLDRDGTVVVDEGYNNYNSVILFPHAIQALLMLQGMGFSLAIITNQSGIGRGLVDESNFLRQNGYLIDLLMERGIALADTSYCPHAPADQCECRKPAPGMLLKYDADFPNSWMIGDKPSDVECGQRAGCQTLLITPEFNLLHAAQKIKCSLHLTRDQSH